jgi:hypothetical protein
MPNFEVSISVREAGRKKPQYSIGSDLNGELTLQELLEWTRSALIITSDLILKEEQAKGFDKNPVVTVDGKPGRRVENVHPLGQIEFTARQNVKDILLETYNALLYRSKVLTGRYKSSHYVFLNGKQVAIDLQSLESWLASSPKLEDKDIIRIVNIQPYARKLERLGVTAQRSNRRSLDRSKNKNSKRTGTILVPNGTYFLTARAIRSKYKRNSIIRFTFLPGSSLGLTQTFKSGRKGKNSAGRPYLYPTIVISVQERGTI